MDLQWRSSAVILDFAYLASTFLLNFLYIHDLIGWCLSTVQLD